MGKDEEEANDPEEETTPPDENVTSVVLTFEVIRGGDVQSLQEANVGGTPPQASKDLQP